MEGAAGHKIKHASQTCDEKQAATLSSTGQKSQKYKPEIKMTKHNSHQKV